jgi:hypothetical protein
MRERQWLGLGPASAQFVLAPGVLALVDLAALSAAPWKRRTNQNREKTRFRIHAPHFKTRKTRKETR